MWEKSCTFANVFTCSAIKIPMSLTKEDIIRLRDNGEQSTVQFKERVTRDNK